MANEKPGSSTALRSAQNDKEVRRPMTRLSCHCELVEEPARYFVAVL
jgi:hypothetical protein